MNRGVTAAKKLAVLALLSGLGLITFILESLLPSMVIPGARPGLANTFSLIALIMYSPWEAFAVVAVRTILGAVFAGNLSALMYSFTGGMVSMGVSSILLYAVHPRISVIAVSVAAAAAHNITQNIIFVFISGSALMFGYMPYIIIIGIISGAVVGLAVSLIFRGIPESVFRKIIRSNAKNNKENSG